MNNKEQYIERHLRHLALPDFGSAGLKRLAAAKVLVIGCGGLGCAVIPYLAGAGIGHLTLCDSDTIELSNLNRQTLFQIQQIGIAKAQAATQFVKLLNPDVAITTLNERVSTHNCEKLFKEHDLILDCTDGLANKLLLNDTAVLTHKPFIHAAATGFAGRLLLYLPQHACLRCVFPEQLDANQVSSCLESGILGPVCGLVGSLIAIESIKLIVNQYHSANVDNYFILNCQRRIVVNAVYFSKNPQCPICGDNPTIQTIHAENYNLTICDLNTM